MSKRLPKDDFKKKDPSYFTRCAIFKNLLLIYLKSSAECFLLVPSSVLSARLRLDGDIDIFPIWNRLLVKIVYIRKRVAEFEKHIPGKFLDVAEMGLVIADTFLKKIE